MPDHAVQRLDGVGGVVPVSSATSTGRLRPMASAAITTSTCTMATSAASATATATMLCVGRVFKF
ncbi:TPA: hypothetical protein PXM48_004275 [Yersinia enterocolitica]|nr:hypothetical protein [Yersinia enterocolitica]